MGSPFEAYDMSCLGSTICPMQFSKSHSNIITLMWQVTAIISFDLLGRSQKYTHSLFLVSKDLNSRNKRITRILNHLQGLHWGVLLLCSIHVAECQKCGPFQTVPLVIRSLWTHTSVEHMNWSYSSLRLSVGKLRGLREAQCAVQSVVWNTTH